MMQGRGLRAWSLWIVLGALCIACGSSDDSAQTAGAGGNRATGGTAAGGTVGTSGSAGTVAGGGAGGSSATSAGSGNSAGHAGDNTAGSVGGGKVIGGYAGLCSPGCPGDEWCAGVEVSCDQPPCLVRGECRKSPSCSATDQSNCIENSFCLQADPSQCGAGSSGTCELVCACRDPGCSFKNMIFNTDPAVCACVTPPATPAKCTIETCPTGYDCSMLLGDAVCLARATSQ
jgi:hypothetical protein